MMTSRTQCVIRRNEEYKGRPMASTDMIDDKVLHENRDKDDNPIWH